MDYKLAEKLEKGGFKFLIPVTKANEKYLDYPPLSELIEKCGDRFHGLWRVMDKWFAKNDVGLEVNGKTPEEVVTKLWLKINKKI